VITILHAVESLVSEGFHPRRTLYLAFGHDEEIGGYEGAKSIAERLAAAKIELDLVIDEGGGIIDGSILGLARATAVVGIAEKGFMNLELTVETEGGHSSTPPRDTAVGVLSRAVSRLEENQMPGVLRTPMTDMLAYLGPEMTFSGKFVIANLWLFGGLVADFFEKDRTTHAMLRTTTAATVFSAGDKANVLPSQARAVVNFRILPGDDPDGVIEHARRVIDDDRVEIRLAEEARNPSTVSSLDSPGWLMLSRTIRELYPDIIVVPYLLVGGSDSRHYTPLSNSIYRFAGFRTGTDDFRRAHGTDERLSLENLEHLTRFFIHLIRNVNMSQVSRDTK
ncbi:MAG: M20/M25/M40 family metallo-hydrolase, partial [Acidobacteria bacterium]|nr:M20/M25/M40 family metallo-hydrolase [Acidobacteriota bacterium]